MAVSLPAVGVRFAAEGDAQVIAAMRRVGDAGRNTGRVIGSIGTASDQARGKALAATQGIANVVEGIARTGETGGAAMRSLVTQVGNLAFAFGVGGPLTAAIGVAGLAIVQMLSNSRDRVLELIEEINRAKLTAGQVAEEAARGRLSMVRGEISGLREELTRLEAEADRIRSNLQGPESQRRPSMVGTGVGAADRPKRIEELRRQIAALAATEVAAQDQVERANRASAITRLALLRQLQEAHRATAEQIREIQALESRLDRDRAQGLLTLEEQVQVLPKAAKKTKDALDEQIAALVALSKAGRLSASELATLLAIEETLARTVADGTKTIYDRAKALQQLQAVQAGTLGRTPGLQATPDGRQPVAPAGKLSISPHAQAELARGTMDEVERALALAQLEAEERIASSFADMLGNAIARGFSEAIAKGDIGAGFKAMTDTFLQGFGSMLIEIGTKTLRALILESTIVKALAALNPAIGIPAALALIALGGSLQGAGSRGGGGRSTGGSFSSGTRSDPFHTATRIQVASGTSRSVAPLNPVVVQVGLVNPADPASQRLLATAISNAQRRGVL